MPREQMGSLYLLQVVGHVDDLLVGDAEDDLDQLLDHSRLLMDDGKMQRPVGREGMASSEQHLSGHSLW